MGLPKEPRQKMINMMYLVLTALLALNVSNEVLEAFKTVDKSIGTSNTAIDNKNKVIYESFADELKDQQTAAKAAIWAPKAEKVKKLSVEMSTYIDQVKKTLKERSQLKITADGKEDFKEDDLDAPTKMFTEEDAGKQLFEKLQKFRKEALAILDPNEFKDQPVIMADIKKTRDQLEKSFPLTLDVAPVNGVASTDPAQQVKDWETKNFHMTPTIAVITILSKYQNDVKNSEAQLVDYFHSQIGKVKVVYNKFEAIAQANRTYAMPGDEIEITAGIGAFSDAATPNITIGGQRMALNGGKATFKTTASGAGEHSIAVKIEYTQPDGTKAVKDEIVKYTVGTPSGASMFLEKMNVVYMDVENPVSISAGSTGKENMKVSFSNGSITSAGGDRYNIVPTTAGMGKVNISVNGKNTPFEVRCKPLPDPVVMVGGITSGSISSAVFKAQGGMIAKLKDSDFMFPFQVISYKIGARNAGGIFQEILIDGPRWNAAAELIKSQAPGSIVYFENIKVMGPGNKPRNIDGTFFTLK